MIQNIVETVLLAAVAWAAVLHLNETRGRPWAEVMGFVLTGAGAVGEILELWRNLGGAGELVRLVFYIGLALISLQVFVRHTLALERIRKFARDTMRDAELEEGPLR